MVFNLFCHESTLECYPEDAESEDIERVIASDLPPLESLVPGMTAKQRLDAFSFEVEKARKAFCAKYGDPFGRDECEDEDEDEDVRDFELQSTF